MMDLEHYFERIPFHKDIRFSKAELPHLPPCFSPTVLGELRIGMLGQYRCRQLHAYEFVDHWQIHKDRWNPENHPVEHLVDDSPHWIAFAAGLIGFGSIMYLRSRNKQ